MIRLRFLTFELPCQYERPHFFHTLGGFGLCFGRRQIRLVRR